MKKIVYQIPFTVRQLKIIDKNIEETLESYLKKNPDEFVSANEIEHLKGMAKDQLTVYIQSLANSSERWSMSHKKLGVLIKSSSKLMKKDLISMLDNPKEDYFSNKDGSWVLSNKSDKSAMSFSDFSKEIYKDLYESASTAAFYAIESFVNCRKLYG